MLSLSDSESDQDPDYEADKLLFGAFLSAPATTNESSPKNKGKKLSKNKEESAKLKERKTKLKEDKAKLKEEKQKALEEKNRLKDEKKKASELLKRQKPGECIKYVSILFDSDLTNCKFGGELLVAMQTAEIQYKVEKLKISNSVLWTRELEDANEQYENHLLVIWTWNELVDSIASKTIDDTLRLYIREYPDYKITLVIFGIEEYFRFQKTLKNRQLKANLPGERVTDKSKKKEEHLLNAPTFTRFDIERSVAKLQLLYDLQYKFLETGQELGLFVTQFTKALAELPFKKDRNKKQENTEWYAVADSKECVRVDNNGNGLIRLWQQQICQFPCVGLDIAQSIVSEYNSPQALIEAYDKCKDRKEAELMLQDIPVRRANGPLTSCRRIGPELSKKMFLFFNNLDGNISLSQEM